MKTFIMTAAIVLASFIGINAQEKYVGFQYVTSPITVRSLAPTKNSFYGAVGSYTKYTDKVVGFNGEGSANFSGASQLYTLTGGLTLRCNNFKSVTPFVKGNAGVGFIHTNNSTFRPSVSDTGLAFKASTGVDIGKGKVKYRLFEVGYLRTNFYNTGQNNLTIGTGITF